MKILQLHNRQEGVGGADEVMAHEREMLEAAGHDVREWVLPKASELGVGSVRAAAKAVWNREAAAAVGRRLDDFRPDVMHVHTPFPLMSPAVFRPAKRRGVATVGTLHSFRYSCIKGTCHRDGHVCEDCVGSRLKLPGIRHRCYHDSAAGSAALTVGLDLHRAIGTLHRDVDRYLALTPFARDLLVRDGYPEAKVGVKPNSVRDPGPRQPAADGPPYVAFAARLVDIKGVRTLLDAWERADTGDLQLRVAGSGELAGLVEAAAGRDPSVVPLGWVSEAEVTALMGGAAAVLVPSEWYEGNPVVICKSLAVGTPVVVSDLENICSTVREDGVGEVFRVGDAGDLARVLTDLAADPGRWSGLRPVARASYERRYSPAVDLERLVRVYEEVVAGR